VLVIVIPQKDQNLNIEKKNRLTDLDLGSIIGQYSMRESLDRLMEIEGTKSITKHDDGSPS